MRSSISAPGTSVTIGANRRSPRPSSTSACGAGPYRLALPSSRSTLTKIEPDSAEPRRRSTASTPSTAQRRRCAATQKSERRRLKRAPLLDRHAGLGGKLAGGARIEVAGHRQAPVALELLDRLPGAGTDRAVAVQRSVAEFGQRPLRRRHLGGCVLRDARRIDAAD